MAASTFDVYEISLNKILDGTIDLDDDTLGALLLVHGHTVDLATHDFVSDIVADECVDGDYAREPITNNAITGPTGGDSFFDCDDIDFGPTVTIAARYCVIYRNVGTDATNEILFICDLNTPSGPDLSSTAGDFKVTINAAGVHKFSPNV